MMQKQEKPDDFVITFRPDATPEEEERFLNELAIAILAIARHLVDKEEAEGKLEAPGLPDKVV